MKVVVIGCLSIVALALIVSVLLVIGVLNLPPIPAVAPMQQSDEPAVIESREANTDVAEESEQDTTEEFERLRQEGERERERRDAEERRITIAEYNQIKTGMTWDEVIAIAGQPTEELSRTELAGTEAVMYMWQNPFGANMNVIFQDGKVVSKAQFGLR